MDEFLALPLRLRDGFFRRCNLEQSIHQSVALLIATRRGMIPFAPEYGSNLWEKEYSDLYTSHKSDVQSALRNAIGQFEPRLYNLGVSLVQKSSSGEAPGVGMEVKVTGAFKDGQTEHPFEATYSLTD